MIYQPCVVVITGCAGFIGSNATVYLVQKYPDIKFIGIDAMFYCADMKNLEDVINKPNFIFIKADFTELHKMKEIFTQYKPDTVIHYGASSHVDLSFTNSLEFTKNNVFGTHVLLEVSKQIGCVKRFIHVSTDEVYGSKNTISTEETTLDASNPYSATKVGAEALAKSYYHSFKFPIIITRGNNVYGPRQYPEKCIPVFILRLLNGKKCQIHGSGSQRRSFQFVDDTVRAFERILFYGKIGEIYNIGSQVDYTILEVAERLIKILKPGEPIENWIENCQDRPFNDIRYFISSDKLMNLGWKPEVHFDDGILKTVEWYKQNAHRWNI